MSNVVGWHQRVAIAKNLDSRFKIMEICLMPESNRFLNEVFRIVNGALRLDIEKVRNYTEFLAANLESAGDAASANRLRKLLKESDQQLRPVGASFQRVPPVDAESRFPLIERINLTAMSEPALVLSEAAWDTVNEFISISKSYSQFADNNLSDVTNMLIYGPPGTGKSRLARHIARELGLELYVARLDGVISSYLGNTAKNIRALFDFASKNPCVMFLDEFDAIAKLRSDSQELGELKRVVNSFIQSLDQLGPQSIVVAATNHEDLLDPAIWRRFSYRVQLDLPNYELRKMLWKELSFDIGFSEKDVEVLADLTEGFSGSDILEICKRLLRRRKITKIPIDLKSAFFVISNMSHGDLSESRFISKLTSLPPSEVVEQLRSRNVKLYSHATLGHLLGISKATVCRNTNRSPRK